MAGTKDIKDFTKFPSLSDNDYLLGTKTDLGGTDAGITVGDFKKQVASDAAPLINENGYWIVNGVSTGEKARGETPVLNGGTTTTADEGAEASSEVVPDGQTPEGAPKYKLNLTLPRGTTGRAGKTAIFGIGNVSDGDMPSATLTSDGEDGSGNPKYKLNLTLPSGETGENGKTPKFETGSVSTLDPGQPASAEINFKQYDTDGSPIYTISLSIPKGDTGDTGKTPVLGMVNAQSGDNPSGSFASDGVDESGNPKYKLNLTLPAGKDGQPAIFEQGATTTLGPNDEARVEVVEGETVGGNPKYILNFFIPRGQVGKPGEGSGNVSAEGAGLVIGKKYLFVPDSDDSTSGSFVEYIAPEAYDDAEIRTEITKNLQAAKTYTNEQIGNIVQFNIVVVESLPDVGVKGTIYLIPKDGSNNDVHDEYIWVESTAKYELIGTTSVDLSDYYTQTEADNAFVKTEAGKRLMTDDEGTKLEGIEAGANKYILPTGEGYNFIPVGGEAGKALVWESAGNAKWGDVSGFDPMILGDFRFAKWPTSTETIQQVMRGYTADDVEQAFVSCKPIIAEFGTSSKLSHSFAKSFSKRIDGSIIYYQIGFDVYIDSVYGNKLYEIYLLISVSVSSVNSISTISSYGFQKGGTAPIAGGSSDNNWWFNGGYTFLSIQPKIATHEFTIIFEGLQAYYTPLEGTVSTLLLRANSGSVDFTPSFKIDTSKMPTGRVVLADEIPTVKADESIEVSLLYLGNGVFVLRCSQPFKY